MASSFSSAQLMENSAKGVEKGVIIYGYIFKSV